MKRIIFNFRNKLIWLFLILLAGGHTFAQQSADTLTEADYTVAPLKNNLTPYSGILPIIVFGVVIALMAFVGYKYWRDNRSDDDIKHTPHHQ